jgi:hypothetical protein
MLRSRRPAVKHRVTAALLTLAAHAGLALLVLTQHRGPVRPAPVARALVSIPITLLPLPALTADALEEATPDADSVARGAPPAGPSPATRVVPQPATAITLPGVPADPAPSSATPPDAGEWQAQATELAARFAEQHEAPPATIGRPLQPMRKPCKPRESSFEWKSDSQSTGSASLTLGWEEPDPNAHLFDDMMAGRRMPSSVPDPNHCD